MYPSTYGDMYHQQYQALRGARTPMQSNTIFTLGSTRLDKTELDILHYIDSTGEADHRRWSVTELAERCNLFVSDATAAVDMLILNGLMENDGEDELMGRMVHVPDIAQEWIEEHADVINCLYIMNDTSLFDEAETATA